MPGVVTAFPERRGFDKAKRALDEIVAAWRVLEELRCRANETWARRREIEPSYRLREKPPALWCRRMIRWTEEADCR